MKCTKCQQDKPETSKYFPLHNKKVNGLDSWCRSCRSSYRNEIRRGRFREVISDDKLKNIIKSTYECVVCGYEFINDTEKTVDHCHNTKQIRGILCNHCNRGIGHFRDDPDLLEYARIYLLSSKNDEESDKYLNDNTTNKEASNG